MKIDRNKAYTTGQIADFLGLSQQTVVRRFDAGEFDGYRFPGSSRRLILGEKVIEFAEKHKIPYKSFLETTSKPPRKHWHVQTF